MNKMIACVYIICIYHKGTTHDIDGLPCIDELTSPTKLRTRSSILYYLCKTRTLYGINRCFLGVRGIVKLKNASADEYNDCVD